MRITHPSKLRAFSLLEIMFATILLGFGFLMVAAVLPIAWESSLDLSEQTRHEHAIVTAKRFVREKPLVDSSKDMFDLASFYDPLVPPLDGPDSPDLISYSFLGDLDTPDTFPLQFPVPADPNVPMVHLMHAENWQIGTSGTDYSLPGFASASGSIVAEAPIQLEPGFNLGLSYSVGLPAQAIGLLDPLVGLPVITLAERVYPPMPQSVFPGDPNWDNLVASRTYTWAIFHQLRQVPTLPTEDRRFKMFYVTLKRASRTARYARQDVGQLPMYPWADLPAPQGPQARGSDYDTLFPQAWRVPLVLWESQTGVPAVAFAGTTVLSELPNGAVGPDPLDPDVQPEQMFPAGTFFIDELSGVVYRVTKRDLIVGAANTYARLSLDQEVRVQDLQPEQDTGPFQPIYRNRIVWVFPPPVVEPNRADPGGNATFAGPPPVLNIEVENVTIAPK